MHHRPLFLRAALGHGLASASIGAALLAGCGSEQGTGTALVGDVPATTTTTLLVPVVGTSARNAAMSLSDGVALTADKLTVVTSFGAATPTATGAVTVKAYDNGAQLAIANNAAGQPMLMGWIDATQTTNP